MSHDDDEIGKHAYLVYSRNEAQLHLKTQGLTNHELREIMVGLWASLDDDDRADHIAELQHYAEMYRVKASGFESDRFLSPIAAAIRSGARR